jgi:hypothetical protein
MHHLQQLTLKKNENSRIFIAQIIQELKVLLGLVKDIEKKAQVNSEYQFLYKHIDQLIDLVIQVIRKKQAHSLPVMLYEISLNELISQLLPVFEIMSARKNNQLAINIQQDIKFVTDEIQFTQALLQVVSNACKYTENGTIEINVHVIDNQLSFTVLDSGIGMDQLYVDQVLSKFKESDLSQFSPYSNLNLGLLLVFQFLNSIGGEISCVSQKSVGTSVTLLHPLEIKRQTEDQGNQVICLSNSIETIRDWQLMIHEFGWEALHIKVNKNYRYYHTNIYCLDSNLNWQQELAYIRSIEGIKTCILIKDFYGIVIQDVLQKQDLESMREIIQSLAISQDSVVLLDGLSSATLQKIESDLSPVCTVKTTFSVSDSIALKVVGLKKYRFRKNDAPVILVIENDDNLAQFILESGVELQQIFSNTLVEN